MRRAYEKDGAYRGKTIIERGLHLQKVRKKGPNPALEAGAVLVYLLISCLLLHQNDLCLKMIEIYLGEADGKLGVEHEDCLVVPRVLAVQVNTVQGVLDQGVGDYC